MLLPQPLAMQTQELQALGEAVGTVSRGVPKSVVDALPTVKYASRFTEQPSAAGEACIQTLLRKFSRSMSFSWSHLGCCCGRDDLIRSCCCASSTPRPFKYSASLSDGTACSTYVHGYTCRKAVVQGRRPVHAGAASLALSQKGMG